VLYTKGLSEVGTTGTPKFAYRVDDGLWSTFLAPSAAGTLEVSHPAFLIQGEHQIRVRSRVAEQPHGISASVVVGFRVDWEAPEIRLQPDWENHQLRVLAKDQISAPETLAYAYQVGHGSFGNFGPARLVDLEAIEQAGGLAVRVRDEAGNIGEASYRMPVIASRSSEAAEVPGFPTSSGCSSAGGELGLLGLLIAAGTRCRRPRH
jgi:hypothetical protein